MTRITGLQVDVLHGPWLPKSATHPFRAVGATVTAGRGPNWDRGPRADHAGAARRCTKRHRRLWAQPGPLAVHGPRELRVDACTSRHRWPRDNLETAGRERAGGAARLGARATRLRMRISAPPATGLARGPWAASGPEELRDSERSHGCRRDAVPFAFNILYSRSRLVMTQRTVLNWLCPIQNWAVRFESCRLNCGPAY